MPNYKSDSNTQGLFIPVILSEQLLKGTIEHAINEIINNDIDIKAFDSKYTNSSTGRKAYHPKTILKIILLAYSKRIYSSREIERACKTNIQFIAISGNIIPDHSTIAAFISSMNEEILGIFSSILRKCNSLNLIGGEAFAVDGCKISSNASKEYSGTFAELENKKNKLEIVLQKMISDHIENDNIGAIEKRKIKYERKIEKINEFLKTNKPREGKRGREVKSNITDNDSGKIKSSHGIIQGYNGMAAVDSKSQIIISAEVFGSVNEGAFLSTMIESSEKNLTETGIKNPITDKVFLADTNYFSEENCQYLQDKHIDGFIPDQYFRKRDLRFKDNYPRREKKGLFKRENFTFDEKTNSFICPAGNKLYYDGKSNNHGYIGRRYLSEQKDCFYCHLKSGCLSKNAKSKGLFITDVPKIKTASEIMINKIDTNHGRKMYSMRMGIVEPVFADITFHKRLNYFTLRTKKKVNIQWLLFCCVHNIGKIAAQ